MNTKVLVSYFSCSGNTAQTAKHIAELTGGMLYEISPETPYSTADLDWRNKQSRSSKEHADPTARPAIAGKLPDFAPYDVIYVGYPVWWGEAPRIVLSFLEKYAAQLTGKSIAPFCTSHSSPLGQSDTLLHSAVPGAKWLPGKCYRLIPAKADVEKWLNSLRSKGK
ncbi:MAG: flavodoxin [Lentisphaerae bacterium]|nr:flavodoxin [Lentisphaerota bacterium]